MSSIDAHINSIIANKKAKVAKKKKPGRKKKQKKKVTGGGAYVNALETPRDFVNWNDDAIYC